MCLPKKVKGTTEFHFNKPCYCSMTLASIWYWASVMVLRDSSYLLRGGIFSEGSMENILWFMALSKSWIYWLGSPLLSYIWHRGRACAPSHKRSFAAHNCHTLTCWQQQHLAYPNPNSLSKGLSLFLESSFAGLPKVAEQMCGRANIKGRSPRWSSCLGHAFLFVQECSDPEYLTTPIHWHQNSGGNCVVGW